MRRSNAEEKNKKELRSLNYEEQTINSKVKEEDIHDLHDKLADFREEFESYQKNVQWEISQLPQKADISQLNKLECTNLFVLLV